MCRWPSASDARPSISPSIGTHAYSGIHACDHKTPRPVVDVEELCQKFDLQGMCALAHAVLHLRIAGRCHYMDLVRTEFGIHSFEHPGWERRLYVPNRLAMLRSCSHGWRSSSDWSYPPGCTRVARCLRWWRRLLGARSVATSVYGPVPTVGKRKC